MSKVEIELNHDNIKSFLRSNSVADDLKSRADRIVEKLGDGYYSDCRNESSRVIASVYAGSRDAKRQNMQENSIIRAVLSSADR